MRKENSTPRSAVKADGGKMGKKGRFILSAVPPSLPLSASFFSSQVKPVFFLSSQSWPLCSLLAEDLFDVVEYN